MSRTDELRAILDNRMEVAIPKVRALLAGADDALVDDMIEVGWIDLAKWRSTEATAFWVNTFALIMCAGAARHAPALRRDPGHVIDTGAHADVRDARALCARVVELRAQNGATPEAAKAVPLPRTKAKLVAHILEHLGDPTWQPGEALIAAAQNPRFKLESFAGLAVYAALLVHGDPERLGDLATAAAGDPILAAILAARGIAAGGGADAELGAELLARVYAEPDSDAARAIYADFLMEHGDPHGPFIAGQLAGDQPPLDDAKAVAWAGAIGAVLRYKAPFAAERLCFLPRYRRGFLSGARVDRLDGALAGAPEWSVIELLDVDGSTARIAEHDLRSLRALGLIDTGELEGLIASPVAAGLEAAGVSAGVLGGDEADLLARLPKLRALICGVSCIIEESLWEHPLLDRLEFLAIDSRTEVPAAVRGRVRVLDLGYGNNTGQCLPFFNELIEAGAAASRGANDDELDRLWQAIAADPTDLGAREAYGTALAARGDSERAELIALQVARARSGGKPKKRERELLSANSERWLGALAPVAQKSGVEWFAGFVSAFRFQNRDNLAVAGAREWATVTALDVRERNTSVAPVLVNPAANNLRSVTNLPQVELIAILDSGVELPWTHLGVWGSLSYFGTALAASSAFPDLESLDLQQVARVRTGGEELLSSPFAAGLRRVVLPVAPERIAEHLGWIPAHIERVEIGLERAKAVVWTLRFDRDGERWSLAIDHASGAGEKIFAPLNAALEALDPALISSASIEAPKRLREAGEMAAIAAGLDRLGAA